MLSRKDFSKDLSSQELFLLFTRINSGVTAVSYENLVGDECEFYADTSYPIIKVILDDNNWLRVYIDKKFKEVTWY